jgi:hypothetical protein
LFNLDALKWNRAMIHSPGSMPTGNFDEPAAPPAERADAARSFRRPADYYSAPLSEVKPVFPAWVPWGCGSLAALVLLVLFAGGAMLSGPRLATLIDLMLSMTIGEIKAMYQPDVTGAQKNAFEAEVKRMREGLRNGTVSVQKVQPFLQTMQRAIGDEKVTAAELEQLTKAAHQASLPPPKR